MTSPFADASRSGHFLLGLGRVCRSNGQQVQRLLLFKHIVDGLYLPIFQYTAAVNFVQQFVQTILLNKLCWTPLIFVKVKPWLLTFARWHHFVWQIWGTSINVQGDPAEVRPTYIFTGNIILITLECTGKIMWFLANVITVWTHTLGRIKIWYLILFVRWPKIIENNLCIQMLPAKLASL